MKQGESIRSWGGFLFGLTGAILGLLGFLASQDTQQLRNEIEAKKYLDKAWELLGGRPGAYVINRAITNLGQPRPVDKLDQLNRVEQEIDKALTLSPNLARAHTVNGVYLRVSGRLNEAAQAYRKALELEADDATYNNLGNVLHQMGRLGDAKEALEKAIQLAPAKSTPWMNLGNVLMDEGDMENARLALQKAVELNRLDASAHTHLGRLFLRQGDIEQALRFAQRAVKLNPMDVQCHNNLGVALEKAGRQQEAVSAYEEAIAIDPTYERAERNLISLRRRIGESPLQE